MNKIAIISNKFSNSKISLGFFTRRGGFSNNNFTSLNCNLHSGDKKNIVKKKYRQSSEPNRSKK